jgi:hypothetical protein
LLQAYLARRYDRDLRHGEKAVEQNQGKENRQFHRGIPVFGRGWHSTIQRWLQDLWRDKDRQIEAILARAQRPSARR